MKTSSALAALAVAVLAAGASGQSVRAVLSADSRPYQDMWEGFREELGRDAAVSVAGAPGSGDVGPARVVVTFGTGAALQEYPGSVKVIMAMAPSVEGRRRGKGLAPHIAMTPDPRILLSNLRMLQPGLKRLALVWKSEFYGAQYLTLLRDAGKGAGVEITSVEIGDAADIPDQLRALYGRVDAIWMPPDALVMSESTFLVFRDYSLSNRIPLYVPIPSLADHGATASVGVSFRDLGRAAARRAKQALDGDEQTELSFAEPAETVLNLGSATKVGLAVDAETLKKLTRVIP
jgi:putative tryptophan/tyrosine transport system substrate-binding protein